MKNTDIEKELTLVTLKIVSTKGHDKKECSATDAIDVIKEQCAKHSKWVYVDGQHKNPDDLTIDQLVLADDITLTNALVGGI